jgi:hypothetical protein
LIEGDNLTVDYGVVRKPCERFNDRGIPAVEIVVVSRPQLDCIISLERDGRDTRRA